MLWRNLDRGGHVCDRVPVKGQESVCDNNLHVVWVCVDLWVYLYGLGGICWVFARPRMGLSEQGWILKGKWVIYYQESSERMVIVRYRVTWLSLVTFRKCSTLRSNSSTNLSMES